MYAASRSTGFGAEVMRRILLGTYVLSAGYYDAYYRKAQQVRTLITRDYEQAFASVDVVAMPTAPTTAFRLGEKVEDPLQMYLADVFTVSANLSGLPAISVPCGLDAQGLPVGLQLTAPAFAETTLLRAAAAYEDARGPFRRPPCQSDVGLQEVGPLDEPVVGRTPGEAVPAGRHGCVLRPRRAPSCP